MGVPKIGGELKVTLGEETIRAVAVLAAALVERNGAHPSLVLDDARRFETYIKKGDAL